MSRKTTFRSNSIVNHTRKTLLIESFVGSDLTSPQTQVSERRAIYSKNYMYRDGKVQKRFSYEQLRKPKSETFYELGFDGTLGGSFENPVRMNGMWAFIAEDGETHVIAHIGYCLYEIKGITTENPTFAAIGGYSASDGRRYQHKFLNQRSYASVGQRKLWFLGGNRYVVVRFEEGASKASVEAVANSSLAFVPTTTIGITYKDAVTGTRTGLDYPNLMAKFRKNMLLSGVGKGTAATTTWYEYTLDAPILYEDEGKDMAEMKETAKKRGEVIENG